MKFNFTGLLVNRRCGWSSGRRSNNHMRTQARGLLTRTCYEHNLTSTAPATATKTDIDYQLKRIKATKGRKLPLIRTGKPRKVEAAATVAVCKAAILRNHPT